MSIPWTVARDRNNHYGKIEVLGPSLRVVGFTVATDVTVEQARQKVADAHLIAAAPVLLDALVNLERYLRNTPHHNAIEAAAARKIIAKATGAA